MPFFRKLDDRTSHVAHTTPSPRAGAESRHAGKEAVLGHALPPGAM